MAKSISEGRAGLPALLALLLTGGCWTPVGVRTVGDDAVSRDLAVNAVDDGRLSNGSLQLLAYLGLQELYAADLPAMEQDLLVDPSVWRDGVLPRDRIESSLETLTEGHPFLMALDQLPVAPGVSTHSIVAVYGPGPVEAGDDRLVAYPSAHRDDADSEVVIRSSHSCQSHPDAVREVRRILRGHLEGHEPAEP